MQRNPTPSLGELQPLYFDPNDWDSPNPSGSIPTRSYGSFGRAPRSRDGDREWSFDLMIYGDPPGFEDAPQVRVSGTNLDKDPLGIYVHGLQGGLRGHGGKTWRWQGVEYQFILTGQPASDVHVDLSSTDWTEGGVSSARDFFTFTRHCGTAPRPSRWSSWTTRCSTAIGAGAWWPTSSRTTRCGRVSFEIP